MTEILLILLTTVYFTESQILFPQFYPQSKFCVPSQSCQHDSQAVCGIDPYGFKRSFLDLCDMYEFNCGYDAHFSEISRQYCPWMDQYPSHGNKLIPFTGSPITHKPRSMTITTTKFKTSETMTKQRKTSSKTTTTDLQKEEILSTGPNTTLNVSTTEFKVETSTVTASVITTKPIIATTTKQQEEKSKTTTTKDIENVENEPKIQCARPCLWETTTNGNLKPATPQVLSSTTNIDSEKPNTTAKSDTIATTTVSVSEKRWKTFTTTFPRSKKTRKKIYPFKWITIYTRRHYSKRKRYFTKTHSRKMQKLFESSTYQSTYNCGSKQCNFPVTWEVTKRKTSTTKENIKLDEILKGHFN